MYKVIVDFYDLQDGNRFYRAGEDYPRPGLEVSTERLDFLAGDGNRMGRPLIVAVRQMDEKPARKRVKRDD